MTIEAFAKVNLTLEVFGERSDGYHALRSVVAPVSLGDTLEIEPADGLSCDTGYADDLCLRAARALDPRRGARIRVTKRIPAGGGLGGGSADAAATLVALNGLWGLGRTRGELVEIAARVGSDVPSLVAGGAVLMEGRGERVTPLGGLPRLDLVLLNPGVHSSTPEVFARSTARADADRLDLDAVLSALASGDPAKAAAVLANDLEPAAAALHPEIAAAREELRAAGALGVTMSGSGSTVFGLVPDEDAAIAAAAALTAAGRTAWAVHTL